MSNARDFAKRMKVLGGNVEDNTNRLVRRVALAIDSTLVLATPVDTGRARANWIVEIGGPHQGVDELSFSPSGAESIAAATAMINTRQPGEDIHITNNLNYIARLNDGWSAQAPAHFVALAVLDGVGMIRGARILVDVPGGGRQVFNGGRYE